MKPDFYTKFVLTVIAVALTLLTVRQYAIPNVLAADKLPVQFAVGPKGEFYFYSRVNGQIDRAHPDGQRGSTIKIDLP